MFACDVVDNTTGNNLLSHVFRGSNSVRDLITMVAVVLIKRTDEIILMHEGVVMSLGDTKLVRLFIGDIDNMTSEQLGTDGNYDLDVRAIVKQTDLATRKVPSSCGPAFSAAPGESFWEYRRLFELWISGEAG